MKREDNNTPRKKFAAFDVFAPKRIIMDAIANKLDGTGVKRLVLTFAVEDDNYKIMVSGKDDKLMKLDVTQDELTTIKKVFIKRIVNAWNLKFDIAPKDVIIQIDVENRKMELFIQNYYNEVLKFDY